MKIKIINTHNNKKEIHLDGTYKGAIGKGEALHVDNGLIVYYKANRKGRDLLSINFSDQSLIVLQNKGTK